MSPNTNVPDEKQIRRLYESLGVKFHDGRATLTIGDGSIRSIEMEERLLLQPKPSDWDIYTKGLSKVLDDLVEVFDKTDASHEFIIEGRRYRDLGRIVDHIQFEDGSLNPPKAPKKVTYYKYLRLEGLQEVSNADWEQMVLYVVCVIATITLAVLISLLPGGQVVVANFVSIVAILAAGCLAIAASVGDTPKNQAWVTTYIGT